MSVSGSAADLALLALRLALAVVFLAHGANHIWGGGKIAGTARWFSSLGMNPGSLHAWTASLTELGAGSLAVLGLLTPFAGAGIVGTMLVAWITNHLRNGFFIFRAGEGWEYVGTLTVLGLVLATLGPRRLEPRRARLGAAPPVGMVRLLDRTPGRCRRRRSPARCLLAPQAHAGSCLNRRGKQVDRLKETSDSRSGDVGTAERRALLATRPVVRISRLSWAEAVLARMTSNEHGGMTGGTHRR